MKNVMRIGACQTLEFIGDIEAALACVLKFAGEAEVLQVDLLLFPECFLQGYIVEPKHFEQFAYDLKSEEFNQFLARLAHAKPTLVLGLIEKRAGKYFNSAIIVNHGQVTGVYRKTHLVPGEALFTHGREYPIFEIKGLKYGLNICYDAQFPESSKAVADQGARVILLPAQNMMRRENAEKWKHEHNRIRRERVKETGVWLVSSDVTGQRDENRISYGPTCALNPSGQVVAQVPLMTVGIMTVDVPL